MAEYIEREALLEKQQERDLCLCVSEADIKEFPAADVAPVVHGRWEKIKPVHYQCSICGINTGGFTSNYCPNCGAKMDEEDH